MTWCKDFHSFSPTLNPYLAFSVETQTKKLARLMKGRALRFCLSQSHWTTTTLLKRIWESSSISFIKLQVEIVSALKMYPAISVIFKTGIFQTCLNKWQIGRHQQTETQTFWNMNYHLLYHLQTLFFEKIDFDY